MRQRTLNPAIVWGAILTSLLATSEGVTEDGITVVVPINWTNLHEEVTSVNFALRFFDENDATVAAGTYVHQVVDGSVQQDTEFFMLPLGANNIFTAKTYNMAVTLRHSDFVAPCVPNRKDNPETMAHCNTGAWTTMQTYAQMQGPISELVPE
jgi:hypothetical protein